MDYQKKIAQIAAMLKASSASYVLTGAGISTESGIPDYRSAGTGLWEKFNPMEVASLAAFEKDPVAYYEKALERWQKWLQAEPNTAHYALARLEKEGYLAGVVTQNVDGLHKKAGSVNLWEVHGHLRKCLCYSCAAQFPMDFLLNQFRQGVNPPLCEECGGILRPYIVLFGDAMGIEYTQAFEALKNCQLLIAAGTSLQVYPVASLPELARELVIINREPTPWDGKAKVVVRESTGRVFADILSALVM